MVNSVRETLSSPELHRFSLGFPDPEAALDFSPVAPAAVAQDELEPILLEHARSYAFADIRFGHEVVLLRQDEYGVDVGFIDHKTQRGTRVRTRYVIAADGWSSPIRKQLGIGVTGADRLGDQLNILFRASLEHLLPAPRCAVYSSQTPSAPGTLMPTSRDGRWVFATPWVPELDPVDKIGSDRLVDLVRHATGAPDLAVEIVDRQLVTLGAQVAERFRDRNVFLVGDAAHRMTPTAGMGMNTAIHSAHNLMWKVAAVLHGWGGMSLLDSYEAERKPVGERNVARSRGQLRELSGVAADMGAVYESAVIASDEDLAPLPTIDPTMPSRPGARAAHIWIERNEDWVSTLDLFDGTMVMLAGPAGHAWCEAASDAARQLAVPLDTCLLSGSRLLVDPAKAWRTRYGLEADRAVLVRPDGHVAWRAPRGVAENRVATITNALMKALGREEQSRQETGTVLWSARSA
jgi:2-polyprenyl-6-methoxyphenol hydroxylase-like FAD-dependent oxidoreductase